MNEQTNRQTNNDAHFLANYKKMWEAPGIEIFPNS